MWIKWRHLYLQCVSFTLLLNHVNASQLLVVIAFGCLDNFTCFLVLYEILGCLNLTKMVIITDVNDIRLLVYSKHARWQTYHIKLLAYWNFDNFMSMEQKYRWNAYINIYNILNCSYSIILIHKLLTVALNMSWINPLINKKKRWERGEIFQWHNY